MSIICAILLVFLVIAHAQEEYTCINPAQTCNPGETYVKDRILFECNRIGPLKAVGPIGNPAHIHGVVGGCDHPGK